LDENLLRESGSKAEWTLKRVSILKQLMAIAEGVAMSEIMRTIKPGRRTYKSGCPTPPAASGDVAVWAKIDAEVKWPTESACIRKEYVPSPWETHWSLHVEEIADFGGLPGSYVPETPIGWECGCKHMRAAEAKIESWLETWKRRDAAAANARQAPWAQDVFSYHRIIDTCSPRSADGSHRIAGYVPIEPLVGVLRHPEHHCTRVATGDKDYMLAYSKSEVAPPLHLVSGARSFLFDLGASFYSSGFGGASQEWFVNTYAKKGIRFDRIFAWEAIPHAPLDIYKPVPNDVMDRLTYFNVPADPAPGAKHNPLRLLMDVAKPDDLVVLKIDIDTSWVETALLKQIMEDPALHGLIDELYYEHHTAGNPLHWTNWQETVGDTVIGESYQNFTRLREVGIRAHSWV